MLLHIEYIGMKNTNLEYNKMARQQKHCIPSTISLAVIRVVGVTIVDVAIRFLVFARAIRRTRTITAPCSGGSNKTVLVDEQALPPPHQ